MSEKKPRAAAKRPARKTTASTGGASTVMASETEVRVEPVLDADEVVRTRAYYLYLERGARPGGALEDWLQAEREVRAPGRSA
jgi:hypothetical protein